MSLNGTHIRAALAAVGAVGGQMRSLEDLAAGANDALRQAPAGLSASGAAAFLATMAQESAYFRTTEEYAKNGRYAPYIGRTFEQVTWRDNYAKFGAWCKARGMVADPNCFVSQPKTLADYKWAWLGGVWFFGANNLWRYANAGNFKAVSQGVNGGNGTIGSGFTPGGYAARLKMFNAFGALGATLLPGQLAPAARPAPAVRPAPAGLPTAAGLPILAKGSTGSRVASLQSFMMKTFPTYAGPIKTSGGADGGYGNGTVEVIKEFQRRTGIAADGVTGASTWAQLKKYGYKP